jgi:tripartite-type tricarboxylate transporter receptor subunit TctC
MKLSYVLRAVALVALFPGIPTHASGEQYPTSPVRIVVGFAPGGAADVISRIFARGLSQQLGQPVIVENKPGADGIIAADAVAKSPPDGYTLYFGSNTALVAVPILRPSSTRYDPFKDFTPVGTLGRFTMFLVVSPDVPSKSVPELIEYIRARPGKLNYASSNSAAQLAATQFLNPSKLDMVHVRYKGDAPALTDLIAGRIHMMFSTGTAVPGFVKEGRMRALATLRDTRSPLLPDVPTAAEAGLQRLTIAPWAALFAPGKMDPRIVERINQALRTTVESRAVRDQLEQQGFEASISTPRELAAFHKAQFEVFRKAVQDEGMKLE